MPAFGILFDQSKCIGCKACEQACQAEHDQRPHVASGLDQETFNWVKAAGADRFVRRFCMHCVQPTCASVCPVAALEKTPEGPVVWHAERCLGCRYCMMACPFEIPKYEWDSPNPRVRKCDMCVHRVRRGQETACASVCPTGATCFGPRADLLREATRRKREHPELYFGQLYGEREAGGTCVLMLLTEPPATAGLPTDVPLEALPPLTWEVLEKIPKFLPIYAAFLGGMYWLTQRKNEVARKEQEGEHRDGGKRVAE
jgi:formate dehydrogenase iron-sulfur subunit